MYASSLIKNKLLSRNAVKHKLLKHNISNEILCPILDNLYFQTDEKELIKKITIKRLRLKTKINENEIVKQVNYLKGKGFHWNDIKIVLGELNLNF
jgi:SOS response regulatory protein OraA/RecX